MLLLYGIALAWVLLAAGAGTTGIRTWPRRMLLVIPLGFFAVQTLRDIGAPALRRARLLAARLADRREWPADLEPCTALPEVKALREALHLDAAPALPLLNHPRPQVQIAALAALDFRKHWRPGQAEMVLQVALRAEEPAVRAAGPDRPGQRRGPRAHRVAGRVPPRPVAAGPPGRHRGAAVGHRAPLALDPPRRPPVSLGDPLCQDDGPLRHSGQPADRRGRGRPDRLGRREGPARPAAPP